MQVSKQLLKAYLATEYRVFTPGGILVLSAKNESNELAALHDKYAVQHSAFITACNPFSEKTEDSVNLSNQARLIKEVSGRWKYFLGEGIDPSGKWPGEPSILVLGITLEEALELGRKYHQHAIVFGHGNSTELHVCNAVD